MKLNALRTNELTTKEGGDINERLNHMANMLNVEWCSVVKDLSDAVDQATNEFDCHMAFSVMLYTKEVQIKNKIEELAKSEVDLYEFIDLIKTL